MVISAQAWPSLPCLELAEESGSGYILSDHPSPDKFLRHVKGGTVCPLIPTW